MAFSANRVLEERGLMKKRLPCGLMICAVWLILSPILKAGKQRVEAPIYSHHIYDIIPDQDEGCRTA